MYKLSSRILLVFAFLLFFIIPYFGYLSTCAPPPHNICRVGGIFYCHDSHLVDDGKFSLELATNTNNENFYINNFTLRSTVVSEVVCTYPEVIHSEELFMINCTAPASDALRYKGNFIISYTNMNSNEVNNTTVELNLRSDDLIWRYNNRDLIKWISILIFVGAVFLISLVMVKIIRIYSKDKNNKEKYIFYISLLIFVLAVLYIVFFEPIRSYLLYDYC